MLSPSLVSLSRIDDPTVTAPANVTPFELVTVTDPMSVPIVPLTTTVPRVLITTLLAAPPRVPEISFTVIAAGPPLPSVNVTPSSSVSRPNATVLFGFPYVMSA